jgi:hypothetical protein
MNENPIYDCYKEAKKESRDTQRYIKNDNQKTVETNNQMKIYLQERE